MELLTQVALLEGKRFPQTQEEFHWLNYMGGPRGSTKDWPRKSVKCAKCDKDYEATGFPSPTGKWLFVPYCKECRTKSAPAKQR